MSRYQFLRRNITFTEKQKCILLAIDADCVKCIEKGSHTPMKIVAGVTSNGITGPKKSIPKALSEYTEEDERKVHKEKKTINIMFNGLDKNTFDNVINCTTFKQGWDTIKIMCEGTEQVTKNKMRLLIQKYEAFHYKAGESLNDIYASFQKLIIGLKLYEELPLLRM